LKANILEENKINQITSKYNRTKYRQFVNKRFKEMKNNNFYKLQAKNFLVHSNNEFIENINKPFKKIELTNYEETCRYHLIKNHLNEISLVLIKNTPLPLFFLKIYYFLELKVREILLLNLSKKEIKTTKHEYK
jgi:hypothetical protein